jgi:pSer/pThr/pTyr-binding forkhead associated (FHA) protein
MYLFFFRVLQATWFGSTTNVMVRSVSKPRAGRAAGREAAAPAASSLVVLEPSALEGRQYSIVGDTTIGRAAGCNISLDDTYISQLHARVSPSGSGMLIEDLGSTNGTYVNRERVTAPLMGESGDRIQLGGIVMEIRQ